MAAITETFLTIQHYATRKDPDGTIAFVGEILEEENGILRDAPMVEGNTDTGYQYTNRAALPVPVYKFVNKGYTATVSQTEQRVETCALLVARGVVDIDHPAGANIQELRMDEMLAQMEGFAQEVAKGLIYNSVKNDPEKFHGIEPRMDDSTTTNGAKQILKADSSASGADQTSVIFAGWHPRKLHLISPRGTKTGFYHDDLGKQLIADSDSDDFQAWVDEYRWKIGLAVRDYRNLIRIADIDTGNLTFDAATGPDLYNMFVQAHVKAKVRSAGRWRMYMNETILSYYQQQSLEGRTQEALGYAEFDGEMFNHFRGIPIRMEDAILNTESPVT